MWHKKPRPPALPSKNTHFSLLASIQRMLVLLTSAKAQISFKLSRSLWGYRSYWDTQPDPSFGLILKKYFRLTSSAQLLSFPWHLLPLCWVPASSALRMLFLGTLGWLSQLGVQLMVSGQAMISQLVGLSRASSSVMTAQSCLKFSLSPAPSALPLHTFLSLSLSQKYIINQLKKYSKLFLFH